METKDDLLCPITYQVFKNPRVLPCGHTFDKEALTKLKKSKCPMCRESFILNQCAPNWIIIKYLNLDINENKSNESVQFTAQDAINEMNIIEKSDKIDKIINKILKAVRKTAILGKSHYVYKYNKFTITPRMIKSICKELNNKNFYTGNWDDIFWYGQLYIGWNYVHNYY